jgi:hypothetical protein
VRLQQTQSNHGGCRNWYLFFSSSV